MLFSFKHLTIIIEYREKYNFSYHKIDKAVLYLDARNRASIKIAVTIYFLARLLLTAIKNLYLIFIHQESV